MDESPIDLRAYHVLAHADDRVVGCWRLLPLSSSVSGMTETLLGTTGLDSALSGLGVGRSECAEAGGWTVHESEQKTGLGIRIVAMGALLVAAGICRVVVATVGTGQGQDKLLERVGARRLPGSNVLRLPLYADSVCFMYWSPDYAVGRFRALMNELKPTLDALLEQHEDRWFKSSPRNFLALG